MTVAPPDRGAIQPVMSAAYDLEQVGDAALLVHQNKAEGKLGVRCLAPGPGLGITVDPAFVREAIKVEPS